MVRYILLNGTRQSGRSTVAIEVCRHLTEARKIAFLDSFNAPIRHFIATALGGRYNEMDKLKPRAEFIGDNAMGFELNLRKYMTDKYGDDVFAKWLVHRTLRNPKKLPDYVIIDDCVSMEEVEAIPCRAVVHINRPKTGFSPYLPNPSYTITNDENIVKLYIKCKAFVGSLLADAIRFDQ